MTGVLKQNLVELADEVQVVDLHDRVLRGSRRITRRTKELALSGDNVEVIGAGREKWTYGKSGDGNWRRL